MPYCATSLQFFKKLSIPPVTNSAVPENKEQHSTILYRGFARVKHKYKSARKVAGNSYDVFFRGIFFFNHCDGNAWNGAPTFTFLFK